MRTVAILAVMTVLVSSATAEARTHGFGPRIHAPRMHAPRIRAPRIRAPRPYVSRRPRNAYRSVHIRRADGSEWTGYRDSLGTHLSGPGGRTINCQRGVGAADIEVACR